MSDDRSPEVRALAALRASADAITSTRDLDDLFAAIGEHVQGIVPFHSLRLFFYDEDAGELYPVAHSTTREEFEEVDLDLPQLRLKLGQGVTGQVAANRRSEVVEDLRAHPDVYYPPDVPALERESYIGVPLVFRDELVGALTLSRYGTGAFDVHELALMEVLGVPLAATLAQARAEAAERRAREQEARLRTLHQTFVGNVSHELRTPLTTAIGFLDLAIAHGEDEELRDDLLARSREGIDRLRLLIERLLEAVAAEASRQQLDLDEHVVGELVERACAEAGVPRDRVTATGETDATIVTDGPRLAHVIAELIENASKHGPQGGAITVSIAVEGAAYAIEVADEGEGIPEELSEVMFDRFVQGDPGLTRDRGGAGIGLSLARSVVRWLGGELRSLPGGPTRLRAELPRLDRPAAGTAAGQRTHRDRERTGS